MDHGNWQIVSKCNYALATNIAYIKWLIESKYWIQRQQIQIEKDPSKVFGQEIIT